MACQIDQIYRCGRPDLLCELGVAQPDRAAPVIGECAEPLGDGVRGRHLGVAVHFDGGTVMRCQQRLGEQGDRVLAEIGRDVADAKPAGPGVRSSSNDG